MSWVGLGWVGLGWVEVRCQVRSGQVWRGEVGLRWGELR